jgi:hypothetical protein
VLPRVAIESERVDLRCDDELLILALCGAHELPTMAIGLHLLIDSLLELLLKLAACLQSLLYVHLGIVPLPSTVCTPCKGLPSRVVARRPRYIERSSLRIGDTAVVEGAII